MVGATGSTVGGGYSMATTYFPGSVVVYGGQTYLGLANNMGILPGSDPTVWSLVSGAGARGATGVTGATGPQGIQGLQGVQGVQGSQGTTGVTGQAGVQGVTGATGVQGNAGVTGSTGATGVMGATGQTGVVYMGAYSNGTTYASTNVVLYNNTLYYNSYAGTTPSGTPPTNTTYWTLFLPSGATGSTGAMGLQGATGYTGTTGQQGATGATGATGQQGATGSTGAAGTVAYQGVYSSGTTYTQNAVVSDSSYYNSYVSLVANNTGHALPASGSNTYWAVLASQGAQGLQGAQGPQGATGPTGNTGTTGSGSGANATGSSPSGIPYTVSSHIANTSLRYWNVASSYDFAGSINGSNSLVVPTACTPSMTLYTTYPSGLLLTVETVTFSGGGGSDGSPVLQCTTSTSPASNGLYGCSTTASSTLSAGSLLTGKPANLGSAYPAWVAFSCN